MSSNRIKCDDIQIGKSFVLPIEQSNLTLQQAKVKQLLEETDSKAKNIIDNAENQSKVIIETASLEASQIIERAKLKAQEEYDTIKQQAYNEGFSKGEQDGLAKFQKDSKDSISALETLASSTFDIKKNIVDSATIDIVELVSAIADKVCHIKFDTEILHKITLDAIKLLKEKENITIIVNPILVDRINSLTENFKEEVPKLESIRIIEDNSVSPDGVIVETLSSRLDSRISTQIAEIAEKMLTGTIDELEQE